MIARWEHFHHGADIGIRGIGDTLCEAYEQAALALTAIVTEPDCVRPVRTVAVSCAAPDHELLLIDWLNAIIYEMAVRRMLFGHFDVELRERRPSTLLSARISGETVDATRHRPVVEPKGATYTELHVGQRADGAWVAQCVVDV
ncbi:MAG: archease [Paraburkholderia sp.]|nr:MAG: archease [Paraburkholderia sp.]